MRALLAQHFLGTDDAGAVDQPVQAAKGADGLIDRRLGGLLVADVGHRETGVFAQFAGLGFYGLGIEVDQHDLGAGLDQHLRGGSTQPGGGAADDEVFVGYLHDRFPFRRWQGWPVALVVWRLPGCAG
ncbi:hypothetical protein D3C72_716850 [compost metagenome]